MTAVTAQTLRLPAVDLLGPALELLRLWRGGRTLDEAEERYLNLVRYGASKFGADLLDAEDVQDFIARLDVLIESKDMYGLVLRMERERATMRRTSGLRVASSDEENAVFGVALAARLVRVFEQTHRLDQAVAHLLSKKERALLTQVLIQAAEQGFEEHEPLVFLTDPLVPVEVAQILLAFTRGVGCTWGIELAMVQGRPLAPWLALALVESFEAGARAQMRYIASLGIVSVPPEVVPLSDRLDLPRLYQEAHVVAAATEQLFAQAVASDRPSYPVFLPTDDE